MEKLFEKRIAVTGHTSGIGKEIFEYCQFNGWDVRGYSRSNGYNIAENSGNEIINALLRWDADIVFNNAWYPLVQNKILKILHTQWKERDDKCIISTGSASAYQPFDKENTSQYETDKQNLRNYAITAGMLWPWDNKCRVHNVSLGWTKSKLAGNDNSFINTYEAALILINLMQPQDYLVAETVVSNKLKDPEYMKSVQERATLNVMEDLNKTHEDLFGHA